MVNTSHYNLIIVSGFICTGSSVLIDVLRGFASYVALTEEFNLFNPDYGLLKLIKSVESSGKDRKYLYRVCRKKLLEAGKAPSRYYRIKRRMLRAIFSEDYQNKKDRRSFDRLFGGNYLTETKSLLYDIKRIIKNDTGNDNNYEKLKDPLNYYVQSLARHIAINNEVKTVIFNQTIKPSSSTKSALDMLDHTKLIVVDRDPRDHYIDLKNSGRLGKIIKMYANYSSDEVQNYIQWYKLRREGFYNNNDSENILVVRFEDLVLQYDKVLKNISTFLDDKSLLRQNNQAYFKPASAMNKVGMWKCYEHRDKITRIQKELFQYCYSI